MSDLVGNPEDRFSHVEAQIIIRAHYCYKTFFFIFLFTTYDVGDAIFLASYH